MAKHFDASLKDLFVAEAIAGDTSAGAFMTSASPKEIAIYKEDGSAVPTDSGKFMIVAKRADGSFKSSGIINGANIISVKQTAPVTEVPEYNYFTVSNSGVSTGDKVSVFFKIIGNSEMDWQNKTISAIVTAADNSSLKIADRLALQMFRNLSEDWYYNNRPQIVHNKAGYASVWTTEDAVITGKAGLTNNQLIWVIANGKAYTVADKTKSTFATICTEKTDWSGEITAGTAVYVNAAKWYDVVVTTGAVVYVIAKPVDRVIDKFAGESSATYLGAWVEDPAIVENPTEFTVTRVGNVKNPTSGKRLANLEAQLDKKTRQYGSYNMYEFKFTPTVVEATSYYTITLTYKEDDPIRLLTGNPQLSTIMLAFDSSTDSDTIYAAILLAKNGAALSLNDLSDVTLTAPLADDQVLFIDTGVWVNGAAPS